ncbi:MAG: hypothetical protein FJW31_25715 [Acidobacteria bacterium]|nr:hypothetical protein [Acidobacteriota bacterium]
MEIIERYEVDKHLPSFLLRGDNGGVVFHVQIAVDIEAGGNVCLVTMYLPSPHDWQPDGHTRRSKE